MELQNDILLSVLTSNMLKLILKKVQLWDKVHTFHFMLAIA